MPLDVSHVDVVRFTFLVSASGAVPHKFSTAGWHAAWVNRKKVGSKDRRKDEMYLTKVAAYQVCMHDKCHYVLYGRTVTAPSLHFR